MRAFEFLTEYIGRGKRGMHKKYRDGGKPDWYEKAVQLKTDNPRMSAREISRQLGIGQNTPMLWLTGKPDSKGYIYNDNPPFTQKDFPLGSKKYFDGAKPDWYEKAVQLKTDNPHMSATKIGRQVSAKYSTILFWLIGKPDYEGRIYNDNPPFTEKDFPQIKYFDGEKPEWYEEAIAMRKQGMMYKDIANKLSTPEKRIIPQTVTNWLVKGRKYVNGKVINPDAPFTAKPRTKPINIDLIKELIVDKYTDEEIIELMIDQKGNKTANQIKAIIPKLRRELQPGTQVIDKTRTGAMKDPDITGFITEVDDQFEAPVGDCFEAAYKKLYQVFREHPEAKLVHAIVTGQGPIKGVQHGHAWVEIGDTVLDYSNGRTIEMPKQIYYAVGNVDPSNSDEYKTYSFKEMADISMDQGTYGPWELPKDSL